MDRDTSFTDFLLSAIENIRETMIVENEELGIPKLAPYQSNGEDISSFLSSLTLTLTTLGGIVLKMDSPDPSKKSFNAEGLGYLLIMISIMCIASQISIAIFIYISV